MKNKSWHIDRRTVLRGMGAAIALPFPNSMAWAGGADAAAAGAKKRFCAIYFPFGVPTLPEGHRHEQWNWYPQEMKDGSYQFREILKPLNGLKNDVTIFQGFAHASHQDSFAGHDSADGFLTGTAIKNGRGKNTISMDQVLADKFGHETRFASMVMSINGGIGAPSRSSTLSYNKDGMPIPAQANVSRIFNRMFSATSQIEALEQLKTNKSILDYVLESSKDLNNKVGKQDQAKLDEYLTSIRQLEKRIQKQAEWVGKPLPKIEADGLEIEATLAEPNDYITSMFDLMFLAFQTDMTRYATFQIGNQVNEGLSWELAIGLGMKTGHHNLAHSMNKDDGAAHYGEYLQYLNSEYARFLNRLKNTPEGSGTMLDNTLSLFGCSNGNPTHSCFNLPIIVSGGQGMGIKQGQYLKFDHGVPLSNLYLTMLDKLGAPQESFADSTGHLDGVSKG